MLVLSRKKDEKIVIGDSITHSWENAGKEVWTKYYSHRKAMNLGVSGDRTEHVLWRLDHGNIDGISPKVAVIMIGTNNTGHKKQDPSETADGIERILSILRARCPETRVLLLGVFPRSANPDDEMRRINEGINELIAKFDDGERVHFLDIGKEFLANDGTLPKDLMPDFLHLSPAGYEIWAQAIEPKLIELGIAPLGN